MKNSEVILKQAQQGKAAHIEPGLLTKARKKRQRKYRHWSEEQNSVLSWPYLIPLLIVAALVPTIVYLRVVPLRGEAFYAWTGQSANPDFFSYYKGIVLQVAAVSAFIVVLVYRSLLRPQSWRWTNYYIPVLIYVTLSVLSALLSRYPEIAYTGFADRYEGLWVLMAYMGVLVATVELVNDIRAFKTLLAGVMAAAVVISLIGVFQYFGYDPFKTAWGQSLIVPNSLRTVIGDVNVRFGEHTIYSTLYHYDYVGSYTAMVLPLSLALFLTQKKRNLKIALGLMTILLAFVWLGCNSRAGLVGGALGLLAILVIWRRKLVEKWKYTFLGAMTLLIFAVALNSISHGYLNTRIKTLFDDARQLVTAQGVSTREELPLRDVKIDNNSAEIIFPATTLNLKVTGGQLFLSDKDGRALPIEKNSKGVLKVVDSRYAKVEIQVVNLGGKRALVVSSDPVRLFIGIEGNKLELLDNKGQAISLERPESWGFQGMERLGSSRGYIWSRSLPLLKQTLIVGHGPDTFAAYFPQNDIFGKMYAYNGDMWQVVDKPHNFYLQTAINTGVLSLLALLGLFGAYIVDSLRTSRLGRGTSINGAVVGILAGVVGYLGAAFFNDSVVSVAPVFWVLLGLGIAGNRMAKREIAAKEIKGHM